MGLILADGAATFPVTSEMLAAVNTNFTSAVAVAVPVGISIMAVVLGIKFVPRLIKLLAR